MNKKLTIITTGLFFFVLAILVLPVGGVASGLKDFLRDLFPWIDPAREWVEDKTGVLPGFQIIRGLGHAAVFAVLSYVSLLMLDNGKRSFRSAVIRTFIILLIFSVLTETAQHFTGRNASITDIAVNMAGCGVGVVLRRAMSRGRE